MKQVDEVRHYVPPEDMIESLNEGGSIYWEIWNRLPDLPFEKTTDRGGKEAWRYQHEGHYIWVPNEAVRAYYANPKTHFSAMMKIGPHNGGVVCARWLNAEQSLDGAVNHVIGIMNDNLREIQFEKDRRAEREREKQRQKR